MENISYVYHSSILQDSYEILCIKGLFLDSKIRFKVLKRLGNSKPEKLGSKLQKACPLPFVEGLESQLKRENISYILTILLFLSLVVYTGCDGEFPIIKHPSCKQI